MVKQVVTVGAVQEDNVMAELNIEPALTAKQFVKRTNEVIESLTSIITPHGLHYKIMDFQKFDPEFLKSAQAKQFGCDPDYNIYTLKQNVVDTKLLHAENIRTDFFIGLPLTIVERESQRKSFYGKAGSFREKEYGIEYRTPSNIWLSSDESMSWIFRQIKTMMSEVMYALPDDSVPRFERKILDIGENAFQEIINNGYVDDAYDICENYGIEIPSMEAFK